MYVAKDEGPSPFPTLSFGVKGLRWGGSVRSIHVGFVGVPMCSVE